jgi:hypothetical protein
MFRGQDPSAVLNLREYAVQVSLRTGAGLESPEPLLPFPCGLRVCAQLDAHGPTARASLDDAASHRFPPPL